MSIQMKSNEDIILWPDGTWCHREDLLDYQHMSDDFEVIPVGHARYDNISNDSRAQWARKLSAWPL